MAQLFVSRKAFRKGLLIYILLLWSSIFIPIIFNRFYPNAGPAAAFLVWLADGAASGFAVFSLFMSLDMLRLLVRDGFNRLCRSESGSPAPGPIALEDGTAEPATAPAPSPSTGTSSTADPTAVEILATPSALGKVVCVISYGYSFIQLAFMKDVMSLQRPLLANVGSTLMFILRGSEVLATAFILVLLVARFKRRSTTAEAAVQAPTTPVDVADVKEEKEAEKL
ncbi:hypothetical protein B0H19DRAFT_1134296 [Mycena capillaripes]|nr:hypothetical protein B0H19DRAFT_1134296 [Mycena capillaripes]